jgi:hypothetical protein
MNRQVRGFFHRSKRNKANFVGQPCFFKRPAHARIARKTFAASGERSNAVMVMVIVNLLEEAILTRGRTQRHL